MVRTAGICAIFRTRGAVIGTHDQDLCDFSHMWGRYRHARPRFVRFFAHMEPFRGARLGFVRFFAHVGPLSGRTTAICTIFGTPGIASGTRDHTP